MNKLITIYTSCHDAHGEPATMTVPAWQFRELFRGGDALMDHGWSKWDLQTGYWFPLNFSQADFDELFQD